MTPAPAHAPARPPDELINALQQAADTAHAAAAALEAAHRLHRAAEQTDVRDADDLAEHLAAAAKSAARYRIAAADDIIQTLLHG